MEAQRPQPGFVPRGLVAAPQRRVVEVAPEWAGEDEVVWSGRAVAAPQTSEASGDGLDDRHGTPFAGLRCRELAVAVACTDAEGAQREVDVAPAQGEQLAHPQTCEGCGLEEGAVLL